MSQASNPQLGTPQQCAECGAQVTKTDVEVVCSDCGLVVDSSPIDPGPEWNWYDRDEKRRVGNTRKRDYADTGLGTMIGHPCEREGRIHRLDKWNRQAQTSSRKDRNRAYASREIDRIGSALDIDDSTVTQAKALFRQLHKSSLEGYDLDTIAPAVVYTATRVNQLGRTPADIAAVSHTSAKRISRRHRWVADELGVPTPPPDVYQRLNVISADVSVSEPTLRDARDLLDGLSDHERSRGSPTTIAATALYLACRDGSADVTQRAIADAAGCSDNAIRNRMGVF